MIYLLWGLLNIGLGILFIYLLFKATKLINEKIGLLASLVLVFGILAIMSSSRMQDDKSKTSSEIMKSWDYKPSDSINRNSTYMMRIDLETNLISKYQLLINYCKDKTGENIYPLSATVSTTGLVIGTKLKPVFINIKKSDENNKFEYTVNVNMNWRLLGADFIYQSKLFEGTTYIR
ncbi:MAG TPA: hypothetical protein PK275_04140 [Chitinophagaceae bacterium]|jgi:hypothetical protein|nr:hypothetical protein [Chitinophagaceae bacterium]